MMALRRSRLSLLVACPFVALSCGDGTGPVETGRITVRGPAALHPQVRWYNSVDTPPRLECEVSLHAQLSANGSKTPAHLVGGALHWSHWSDSTVAETEELPAEAARAYWGTSEMEANVAYLTRMTFWAAEPFRVTLDLHYTLGADAAPRTTSYTLRCEPPAPPLNARYVLRTINGVPLPAPSGQGTVYVDTIDFLPNLTYTTRGQIVGPRIGSSDLVPTSPRVYAIPSAGVVEFGEIMYGVSGRHATLSASALDATEHYQGEALPYVWRFERIGDARPVRVRRGGAVSADARRMPR